MNQNNENIKTPITKIGRNFQITIPQGLRDKSNLDVGDYVRVFFQKGDITLRPLKFVEAGQDYFYTKEWQKKEAEADEDIRKGRVAGPFNNVEDAINKLKSK